MCSESLKINFLFCFALQDAKTGGAHYREMPGKIALARACFVSPLVAGHKSVNTIFCARCVLVGSAKRVPRGAALAIFGRARDLARSAGVGQ